MPIEIEKLTSRKGFRKEQILGILEKNPTFAYTSEELAELFKCSQSTITRALVYLINKKKVVKGYQKGITAKIPYYYYNSEIKIMEKEIN